MRHTKIIATIGPTSSDAGVVAALIAAGVDVFRLNFSHGTHESHDESIRRIRAAAADAGRHVAIMQDLSGPKIRTGPLAGGVPLDLNEGRRVTLCAGADASTAERIFTPYAALVGRAGPAIACSSTTAASNCASTTAPPTACAPSSSTADDSARTRGSARRAWRCRRLP